MRWLVRLWRCHRADAADARDGLEQARERLAEAHRVGEEVAEVAAELRALRRRNRFGPMITEALRGDQ